MWSDAETDVDLLSVQHIVDAVESVVREPRVSPVTIGVFGDWGSGKSSVVRMLRARLEGDLTVLCVYFNGWRFEGYEDAKAALASTILDELGELARREPTRFERALTTLKSLRKRVDWLRFGKGAFNVGLAVATGGVSTAGGVAATALAQAGEVSAEDLDKMIKARAAQEETLHTSVRDFHQEFASLLKLAGVERLVVIVDDLDRCLPERVIETLEAIRLFLAVEGTAFVIAADQALIRHAIALRYPGLGEKESVGRDYLERMIQVPIEVPPLTRGDLEAYVHLLFAERRLPKEQFVRLSQTLAARPFSLEPVVFNAANAAELLGGPPDADLTEDLALATQVSDVLALSVRGNPRQTKRFLNALTIRVAMLTKRGVPHQRAVAAKLLLLEYFKDETFRTLAHAAVEQGGAPAELRRAEREARTDNGNEDASADTAIVAVGGDRLAAGEARRGGRSRVNQAATTSPETAVTPSIGDALQQVPSYLSALRTDPWLHTWLASDPPLAGLDLRPYVHFARERLSPLAPTSASLSSEARSVLALLTSSSEASQRLGADRARTLIAPDVVGIVRELTGRARRSETISRDGSELFALFHLSERRPEIFEDVVAMLGVISVSLIEPAIATRLLGVSRAVGVERPSSIPEVRTLLTRWRDQRTNGLLATAAANALTRLDAVPSAGRTGQGRSELTPGR